MDGAVEIVQNQTLLKLLPESQNHWLKKEITPCYQYEALNPWDPIFKKISKMLTVPQNFTVQIETIKRLQNAYLITLYNLKKEDLLRSASNEKDVTERYLFHGTQQDKIASISKHNLDYRLSGTQKGTKHGKGVSFSPKFYFSSKFCEKKKTKVMFLCKVLFSKSHVGDVDNLIPKEGYDATASSNNNVIVKYDDNTFYPEYLIHFSIHNCKTKVKNEYMSKVKNEYMNDYHNIAENYAYSEYRFTYSGSDIYYYNNVNRYDCYDNYARNNVYHLNCNYIRNHSHPYQRSRSDPYYDVRKNYNNNNFDQHINYNSTWKSDSYYGYGKNCNPSYSNYKF